MDKIRNAAIVLLGLGDKYTTEVLKNMSPKEVRLILDAITNVENISEADVTQALNDFFQESNNAFGVDASAKEQIKHSILAAVGNKGIGAIIQGIDSEKDKWLELIKVQSATTIVDLIQDEHPQIVTALTIIIFNYISSDYGTKLIKSFPKPLQNKIFKRMTNMSSLSRVAIDAISVVFEKELQDTVKNSTISLDGLETVANIISYLDSETEHEIMDELTNDNKALGEKIQDKIFPFSRLAELDKKSMQILLKEVKNEDLIVALKGVEEHVKNVFMQNMSIKSAEILRDEMESKGPVKLAHVLDAQKRIIRTAKQLDQEEKIILSSKNNPGVVF
jgi:flagellar motor switch protein FliG